MAHVASLALRGVTLSLSSATIIGFSSFNADLYLSALMSTDTYGKAVLQRKVTSRRGS